MALAARVQKRSYRVYCMLGDGELDEGQIWEAAMAASHYRLQGLVAIVDRNQLCIDGHDRGGDGRRADRGALRRLRLGRRSASTATISAPSSARSTSWRRPATGQPQMIVADTIKGRGVKRMELALQWHVGNLAGEDYDEAEAEIQRRPETARDSEGAGMTARERRTTAQDQNAIFRGTDAPQAGELKDARSVAARRTRRCRPSSWARSWRTSPTSDPRIVVLTADLANANRTGRFRGAPSATASSISASPRRT